jgi:hypothetical protein
MATLTQLQLKNQVKATHSLTGAGVAGATLAAEALDPGTHTLNSSTTVPASGYHAAEYTLAGSGAASTTIDLTALDDIEGATITAAGKKVQMVRLQAQDTNVDVITVAGGDSDPYELFGAGNSVDIQPGQEVYLYFPDVLPDIGTTSGVTATDIKISGTGGDVLNVEIGIG